MGGAAGWMQQQLGHAPGDPLLFERALTHRSQGRDHNERLEFLGDAVLSLVVAELLVHRFPDATEGELSRLKSHLVSARTLGHEAEVLGLGDQLRLGVGEERSGGRKKASLLTDSLEAVFGALYLDGGLRAARDWIEPMLERELQHREIVPEGGSYAAKLIGWVEVSGGDG